MSESVAPLPPETAEALSLHALDLLPAEERAALEVQLAADPALRRELRELQGTLDGLVESLPARPAPLHVWGRIAATVRSAEAPVFATGDPTMERRGWAWGWQALGAAACLAAGMGLHAWWIQRSPSGGRASSTLASQGPAAPTRSATVFPHSTMDSGLASARTEAMEHPSERSPAAAVNVEPAAGTPATSGKESAPANWAVPREHALQTQVAVLTELLNRELGTPPGTSRLQIVRLVGPGETAETAASTAIQPETLAALALTLINPPPSQTAVQTAAKSTTTTGSTESSGSSGSSASIVASGGSTPSPRTDLTDVASSSLAAASATPVVQVQLGASESAATAAPASTARETGSSIANSTSVTPSVVTTGAIEKTAVAGVAVTPATGSTGSAPTGVLLMLPKESAGTAVISNPTPLAANEVYQFWQTDPATGTAINLGTAHSDATTAIFNFSLTQGKPASSVFITREPSGGSATPTGPVVVSTPAPKP